MSLLSTPASDVTWLISTFVERIPGVRQALVATADGSPLATSSGLGRSRAARLAGVAAGLAGLAPAAAPDTGADAERGPTVTDLRIDTDQATLLVRHISDGSLLVVVADRSGDAVLIGYEMAALAERVGAVLTPALRAELLAALAG